MNVENTLYYGDNLDILHRYIADESVDLVYLDPPFNSNQSYDGAFLYATQVWIQKRQSCKMR
jgi:16S rRNA G966 N2-methylase RsmD